MTTAADQLIGLLDPSRDYGKISFATVLKKVDEGKLLLRKGHLRPVIVDAKTMLPVKGSGRYPLKEDPHRVNMAMFQAQSVDDIEDFYSHVWTSIAKGDVRAMKLWAEINGLVGNSRDPRAGEMNSALAKLIEAAAGSIPTSVSPTYIDVKVSDV